MLSDVVLFLGGLGHFFKILRQVWQEHRNSVNVQRWLSTRETNFLTLYKMRVFSKHAMWLKVQLAYSAGVIQRLVLSSKVSFPFPSFVWILWHAEQCDFRSIFFEHVAGLAARRVAMVMRLYRHFSEAQIPLRNFPHHVSTIKTAYCYTCKRDNANMYNEHHEVEAHANGKGANAIADATLVSTVTTPGEP